jgi:hypothetical protein
VYGLVAFFKVLPAYLSSKAAKCRLQDFSGSCSDCVFTLLVQYNSRNLRDKAFLIAFERKYPSGKFGPVDKIFSQCPTDPIFDCCKFRDTQSEKFCDQWSTEALWDCYFDSEISGSDVSGIQVGRVNFINRPLTIFVVAIILSWIFAELGFRGCTGRTLSACCRRRKKTVSVTVVSTKPSPTAAISGVNRQVTSTSTRGDLENVIEGVVPQAAELMVTVAPLLPPFKIRDPFADVPLSRQSTVSTAVGRPRPPPMAPVGVFRNMKPVIGHGGIDDRISSLLARVRSANHCT